jgi:hypothetical protein
MEYRLGQTNKLHKRVTTKEAQIIIQELHQGVRGHFVINIMAKNIFVARIWWPTLFKNVIGFYISYNVCYII